MRASQLSLTEIFCSLFEKRLDLTPALSSKAEALPQNIVLDTIGFFSHSRARWLRGTH
jgi:hypothetical protein